MSTKDIKEILIKLKEENNRSSTNNSYYGTWKNFNKFIIRLDYIPATWEERAELYCAYLITYKNLQSSTVRSYISGIKSVLIKDGYKWNDQLLILSAITKSCKLHYDVTKIRLPIQHKFLELILFDIVRRYGDKQPYLEALYTTALLFGYYGLMRIGELCESVHVIKARDVHKCEERKKIMIFFVYIKNSQ